jgi:hypothetical protein
MYLKEFFEGRLVSIFPLLGTLSFVEPLISYLANSLFLNRLLKGFCCLDPVVHSALARIPAYQRRQHSFALLAMRPDCNSCAAGVSYLK